MPVYRLSVCDLCWQQAQEGWPKEAESILFAALAKAGLLMPDRNDRGLLPRQYAPPKDYALKSSPRLCIQLVGVSRGATESSLGAIMLMF